jgi:predicted dienelactone hydrolase
MTCASNQRSKLPRRCRSIVSIVILVTTTSLVVPVVVTTPLAAAPSDAHLSTASSAVAVGVARCTFVDHTRPVLNYSTTPNTVLSTSRRLVTEVRYRAHDIVGGPRESVNANPVQRSGGYPMIVFAHGYDVTPDTYAALLDAWVRAGFVVVAPYFPDEQASAIAAQRGANTEGDLANEPADLSFVTKEILDASAAATSNCPIVKGLVRASEIALAGHSDGADAVAMLAYGHGTDPQGVKFTSLHSRIDYRAVVIMSGKEATAQPYAAETGRPSLLVIQSLADTCNPFVNSVKLYDRVHQSNKWFLELRIAHHLPPFNGTDRSDFRVVTTTSIGFLQVSLHVTTSPRSLVALGNQNPSLARMYASSRGPSLSNAPTLVESCGPN